MPLPRVEHTVLPLVSFVPADYNPRFIKPAARKGLRASLKKFGLVQGIVLNRRSDGELRIVGGHQRVDELLAVGEIEAAVAIVEVNDIDEKALNLALNNPEIAGDWNPEELGKLLEQVQAEDAHLFEALRLDALFEEASRPARGGHGDPDAAPPPPEHPISLPGDIWLLGNHRLICGDSTDAGTVALLLAGVKPHLMVTDQPYGVSYDAEWRVKAMPLGPGGTAAGGNTGRAGGGTHGKVKNDDRADWSAAWALFPGDVAYLWHDALRGDEAKAHLGAHGFEVRAQIVWAKSQHVIGRGHYHWQHEACWYAVRRGTKGHWTGDRTQSTVWNIERPSSNETGHSTQKPVDCMKRPIENNSNPGQAVYEPFSGSGTTIIAGEMTGRHVYAVEIHPAYVDQSVVRWQLFTGLQATLAGDGRTFEAVMAERKAVL